MSAARCRSALRRLRSRCDCLALRRRYCRSVKSHPAGRECYWRRRVRRWNPTALGARRATRTPMDGVALASLASERTLFRSTTRVRSAGRDAAVIVGSVDRRDCRRITQSLAATSMAKALVSPASNLRVETEDAIAGDRRSARQRDGAPVNSPLLRAMPKIKPVMWFSSMRDGPNASMRRTPPCRRRNFADAPLENIAGDIEPRRVAHHPDPVADVVDLALCYLRHRRFCR